ncbi:MAG: hypothetical protein FJ138_00300 [Deltaproteobacteria bacterium]|nr:hypothetical protein [Deltaproteobacteria bacterium]
MDARAVAAHNDALARRAGEPRAQPDLRVPLSAEVLNEQVRGRLAYVAQMFDEGVYVKRGGGRLSAEERALLEARPLTPAATPELRVALTELQTGCAPVLDPIEKPSADRTIDRNACTRVKEQALVEVLAAWPGGFTLIRSRLALGWLPPAAPGAPPRLSPPVSPALADRYVEGPFAYLRPPRSASRARVPRVGGRLLIADAEGAREVEAPHDLPHPALTRRALLTELFRQHGAPYGLGGDGGGTDCSQTLVNALEAVGLRPPRHSSHIAEFGTFSVPLTPEMSARDRLALLDAALARGVVLLSLPGHIAAYLGRDARGEPMIFHAMSDFQRACAGGGETMTRVGRATVTTVWLGEGSSKGSYLARATQLTALGGGPPPALEALAAARAPAPLALPSRAECRAVQNRARIFTSPARPSLEQPLRVMVTRPDANTPARLALVAPSGQAVEPALVSLGGPPYALYAELPPPTEAGEWRAVFGEGGDLSSCTHFSVERRRAPQGAEDPALWTPVEEWGPHTEALYAAFVRRLFDYPLDDDRSWRNLQDLLGEPGHNLLRDHLSAQEDERLRLEPDCADLPYTLRAYFAWKLRLPMGYMSCSRGSRARAPSCQDRRDSTEPREGRRVGDDFQWFARRRLAGAVHSASARTLPDDDETDLYPVALTREALRPGVVFADPYGHILMVAGWSPQGAGGYGVLMGADGQPDSTISRRRFWEGSFLFDPDRAAVGAGFKAFRPLVSAAREGRAGRPRGPWRALRNDELTAERMGPLAYSEEQYAGPKERFYDAMGALISPRPLDARVHLSALVDALHESARRRVESVDNGEAHHRAHPRAVVPMPTGYAIFETSGPWEDFATPSRDMRLLIAIDTALSLPSALTRAPERFGLTAAELPEALKAVSADLRAALRAREFTYTQSDGAPRRLTLEDLVARAAALEVAYNPNDCPEARWGAPEGSAERASCARRAPDAQRRLMERYRPWFHERRRPPRGSR